MAGKNHPEAPAESDQAGFVDLAGFVPVEADLRQPEAQEYLRDGMQSRFV
jgi:hypothetical protein